jgi:hypothetical protein
MQTATKNYDLNVRSFGLQYGAIGSRSKSACRPAWMDPTIPTYQGGCLVGREQKSWNGMSALTAEVRCGGHMQADLRADCTRLSVFLEEVGGRVEIGRNPRNGNQITSFAARPLSLIPSDMEVWAHSDRIHFIRHLILHFDGPTAEAMLDEEIDLTSALTPRLMFYEPRLLLLAQLIADECARDEFSGRLYGDSLSIAVLLCLSKLDTCDEAMRRGGLAPWQNRVYLCPLGPGCSTENLGRLGETVAIIFLSSLQGLNRTGAASMAAAGENCQGQAAAS